MRLLEREHELGLLAGAVQDAVGGTGSLVLVGGEAGIGKTSLVRALRTSLPEGVSFVSGACEPLSVPVPLAPWRELSDAAGAGDLAARAGDDRLALAQAMLSILTGRAPVVAVVEDAHWADPLTIDLLRILARRVEEAGVVVVVTYRDDEVAANSALGLLLGDLMTNPAVRRLVLRPLSDASVQELAAGSGLDGGRLLRATGGNPFLLVETIAAGGGLPASVRDAALARAGRLSAQAREVVDVAAAVGQRFDAGLLGSLMGECSGAVEEALGRGVLRSDGAALGFRHELIREALEQSMSAPRRAEVHARVFAVLAERPESADKARLAHHAELGGLADQASHYAMLAAADAERVGAVRETYLQAGRALRLGRGLDPAERFELLVQYARASNFANPDLEDGVDAGNRAVALAEELDDDLRRGRALMTLAYNLWSLERVVEARAAAEQAVGAFEPSGDPASLAWAYATLIRMETTSFDPARAVELSGQGLELADAAGLEEVGLDVAISLGLARGHRGEAEALESLSDALARAKHAGLTIRMVRAYVNLMTVAVALRDHERVDQIAAEALPVLEERGVSKLPIMALRFYRARSLLDRGRWDEALGVAASRARWWQGEFAVAEAMEGLIGVRRGAPDAHRMIQAAWSEMVDLVANENSRHGMIRAALIEAAWLRDDRAGARAEFAAARDSPGAMRFARPAGEVALWGQRLGLEQEAPVGAPSPVLLELAGDWRGAIGAWQEVQAPYEAALAALPGDERAARQAVSTLQKLGAAGAARAFARERGAHGGRVIRGARRSTLANPAGLTRREQQVLEVLGTGASNASIAQELHLSERTVAHHVSAILAKFGASNRHLAVEEARHLGLLSERTR